MPYFSHARPPSAVPLTKFRDIFSAFLFYSAVPIHLSFRELYLISYSYSPPVTVEIRIERRETGIQLIFFFFFNFSRVSNDFYALGADLLLLLDSPTVVLKYSKLNLVK